MDMDDAVRMLGQRNWTTLLNAMAERTQVRMAESMGLAEATVSDIKKQAERVSYMLAAAGLKVVPSELRTYDAEELAALRVLARKGIDREPPPSGWGTL